MDLVRKLHNIGIMQKDPVCGMDVNPKKTKIHSTYNGKHYLFCSKACKNMFDANPEKYTL